VNLAFFGMVLLKHLWGLSRYIVSMQHHITIMPNKIVTSFIFWLYYWWSVV